MRMLNAELHRLCCPQLPLPTDFRRQLVLGILFQLWEPLRTRKKKLKQTQIVTPVRLQVEHSGRVLYGNGSFTLVQSHRRSYLAR